MSYVEHPYTKFKVQHFPQLPGKSFEQEFDTLREAVMSADLLGLYDLFLFAEGHRTDYSNASVVRGWNADDEEWEDLGDYEIEELLQESLVP
jgi:hypothetical protein